MTQKWSKRWSKSGHLRVPKTPILAKNGDFWTKTPRGGSRLSTTFLTTFGSQCGGKIGVFDPKNGPKSGVFGGSKNGHFGKTEILLCRRRRFFRFLTVFFCVFLAIFVNFWHGRKWPTFGITFLTLIWRAINMVFGSKKWSKMTYFRSFLTLI